ncbi:hypothetical protein I8748_03980 [Nostoc sp. CENA67]|uniref:Uncharacterized protein n=1 Tax=Amazonocrinis nigriterrae CENA67 TaxID=2794033 RepID=A0A8J7HKM8_9NOST|nr:hypothetical protein [Amazonocrinis nigriterrae]MBH8561343.1 hypothetical protein [Amazonocrinis nigriterrae CENA67]
MSNQKKPAPERPPWAGLPTAKGSGVKPQDRTASPRRGLPHRVADAPTSLPLR